MSGKSLNGNLPLPLSDGGPSQVSGKDATSVPDVPRSPIKFDKPKRAVFTVEYEEETKVPLRPELDDGNLDDSNDERLLEEAPVARSAPVPSQTEDVVKVSAPSSMTEVASTIVRPKEEPTLQSRQEEPSAPRIGVVWDLVSFVGPAIAIASFLISSITSRLNESRLMIPIIFGSISFLVAVFASRRQARLPLWRSLLAAVGLLSGFGLVSATYAYGSTLFAWIAILVLFFAWGLIRFAGESTTRLLAVISVIICIIAIGTDYWLPIDSMVSNFTIWTSSGLMDMLGVFHTTTAQGISFGPVTIEPEPFITRWSGFATLVALSLFLSILWRRSLLVTVGSLLSAVGWWTGTIAILWSQLDWQQPGAGNEALLESSMMLGMFILSVFGLVMSDLLLGEWFAPIPLGKFDTDAPLVTVLWNRLVGWPAAAVMREVELDNAGFMDDEEVDSEMDTVEPYQTAGVN